MPRPDLFLVGLAVMFLVAAELAFEHSEVMRCLMWIDIIERRRGEGGGEGAARCCGLRPITLSKILNLLRRELLLPLVPSCTVFPLALTLNLTLTLNLNPTLTLTTTDTCDEFFPDLLQRHPQRLRVCGDSADGQSGVLIHLPFDNNSTPQALSCHVDF